MNPSVPKLIINAPSVSDEVTRALCNLEIPRNNSSRPIGRLANYLLAAIPRSVGSQRLASSIGFRDFVRHSSGRILARIGNELYLQKNPHIVRALARFLRAEYELVVDLGYSGTASKVAAKESIFYVADLYLKAKEICSEDPILKPIQGTLVHLVLHGTHKNIESVAQKYRDIYSEAKTKLANVPEAANLIRTISTAVILNNPFKSVDQAIERYRSVYEEVSKEFSEDPSLNSILRSVTLMIFEGKKYKTATDAKKAFATILPEAVSEFGMSADTVDLARTAAFLTLRGRYATVKVAKAEYERILKEVSKVCGGFVEYQGIVRTISFAIFNAHYKNAAHAKIKLDDTYKEAKKLLSDIENRDDIINTAVLNVFLARQPNVEAAILNYFESESKARELITRTKISFGVGVGYLVTRKANVDEVVNEFQSLLSTAERLTEDSRIKLTAHVIAISVLRKAYPTVEKASEAYLTHQREVLEVIGDCPVLSKFAQELTGLLFRKVATNLADAMNHAIQKRVEPNASRLRELAIKRIPDLPQV